MYVCMCIRTYVCMYVSLTSYGMTQHTIAAYVLYTYVRIINSCIHVCMHANIYIHAYICMYIHMYIQWNPPEMDTMHWGNNICPL